MLIVTNNCFWIHLNNRLYYLRADYYRDICTGRINSADNHKFIGCVQTRVKRVLKLDDNHVVIINENAQMLLLDDAIPFVKGTHIRSRVTDFVIWGGRIYYLNKDGELHIEQNNEQISKGFVWNYTDEDSRITGLQYGPVKQTLAKPGLLFHDTLSGRYLTYSKDEPRTLLELPYGKPVDNTPVTMYSKVDTITNVMIDGTNVTFFIEIVTNHCCELHDVVNFCIIERKSLDGNKYCNYLVLLENGELLTVILNPEDRKFATEVLAKEVVVLGGNSEIHGNNSYSAIFGDVAGNIFIVDFAHKRVPVKLCTVDHLNQISELHR